ncbi:NAD(P)-dependent dehydrogenase, short-chain alcohol dehydrogenase family [Pedobacter westerhofensis]|uniref:NAD(P)-dependent dehydrogenase, short-chain alcohol dehydrogenase family n=1 Tax=Pedobacter westerhofensis TaxID=425512 RepID=A0A521F4L9_9SPHI|nr:SDR family oxidoreductase [Pedobacter westerhofensis]SMO91099.1 NAD(P)-dependent dehydrogenase, short-chain alcohol dehydrogenase family [Pedobacter westerhofensis]
MTNKKRVAIVTGGAAGLGLAITRRLVSEGITTVMIGRNEKNLRETAAELGSLCSYKVLDLQQVAAIPACVQEIVAEFGQLDILVNNAGINHKKPFLEVTDDEFFHVIQTNVLSVFAMSREVARLMAAAGSGSIVNISSMAAQYGIPKVIAYTAAKSAIEGMTKAMAVELSPLGIRINCVAPGFIKTDMSSKALDNDPERKNKVLSRTPMGYLGLPEDIADAVFYLSSANAKYITGVIMPVDGGNSVGF